MENNVHARIIFELTENGSLDIRPEGCASCNLRILARIAMERDFILNELRRHNSDFRTPSEKDLVKLIDEWKIKGCKN